MNLIQELHLTELLSQLEQLDEDFSWDVGSPLEAQLKVAAERFFAAQRALGIVNRLKDPVSKKKHRSRVMSMLNKLRASLDRLHQAIDGELEAMQQDPSQAI